MRGVCWAEPNFLAIVTSLNARRFSVRTKTPGGISQFESDVRAGNSWRYFPIWIRGVFRSGPKFLAVFPSLNARCFSVRTETPGDISQFKCEVSVGQDPNTWRSSPIWMRGVVRSEPKFLAIFTGLNARRFAARPKTPGSILQ